MAVAQRDNHYIDGKKYNSSSKKIELEDETSLILTDWENDKLNAKMKIRENLILIMV